MTRKRYSDEDILKLLREIEVKLSAGSDVQSAFRGSHRRSLQPGPDKAKTRAVSTHIIKVNIAAVCRQLDLFCRNVANWTFSV